MCIDANAGARAQAREKARQKDAVFAQEKLKFFNKETSFSRTLDRNVIGYSRDFSDAYVQALYTQGKGRKQQEDIVRAYFSNQKVNEGGRSTKFGVKDYQSLLSKKAEVESIVDNLYGRNMAYARQGAKRKFMAANAQGRESLGIPAAYGAPVMLPPTDRLSGALGLAGQLLGIATGIKGLE